MCVLKAAIDIPQQPQHVRVRFRCPKGSVIDIAQNSLTQVSHLLRAASTLQIIEAVILFYFFINFLGPPQCLHPQHEDTEMMQHSGIGSK